MLIYRPGRPIKYVPAIGKGAKPPHAPGEYRLRDQGGTIQYIGETCDLSRRMSEHVRSGKLAAGWAIEYMVADSQSTSFDRRGHERQKIHKYQPPLNQSRGGEGRLAGS